MYETDTRTEGTSLRGWTWVKFTPAAAEFEHGLPLPGTRVTVRPGFPELAQLGLPAGTRGKVVGYGRSKIADQVFRAASERGELSWEDYDILTDAEGPLVEFVTSDGRQVLEWLPGRSFRVLAIVSK